MTTHLDQLHDQIQFAVSVHLLYEQHNIWMFDPAQDGHFVLNHVLLRNGVRTEFVRPWKIWTVSHQVPRAAADLSSAFALVDDLQRVLPSRAVLHAFPHHCKVAVAQHSSHLVAVRDVGRHSWNLVEQDLSCRGGGKTTKGFEQTSRTLNRK